MSPTRAADEHVLRGRWRKAQSFAEAAELLFPSDESEREDQGDVFVSLAVLSGIAAADVICIARRGKYAPTGAHDEALALLGQVDTVARTALQRLLSLKTKAEYTYRPVSGREITAAQNAMDKLMRIARESI